MIGFRICTCDSFCFVLKNLSSTLTLIFQDFQICFPAPFCCCIEKLLTSVFRAALFGFKMVLLSFIDETFLRSFFSVFLILFFNLLLIFWNPPQSSIVSFSWALDLYWTRFSCNSDMSSFFIRGEVFNLIPF